jgi:CRP-like cAMP-binding protein
MSARVHFKHRRSSPSSGSRLLAALPSDVLGRFQPKLELVNAGFKDVLYGDDEPIAYVYFPINAVVSVLTTMENGDAVEVGTIGNEGFAGLPVLLDTKASPASARAFAQIPGEMLRIGVEAFREELRREPALHSLLLRYANAFVMQIAQSGACNRLHTIDARCCRWLLMTHDRVGADFIPLTQEFLAQMLGVRRASVNAVAGLLQREGLIRYSRGKITILNREGLEKGACECYQVIRREFERLLAD